MNGITTSTLVELQLNESLLIMTACNTTADEQSVVEQLN